MTVTKTTQRGPLSQDSINIGAANRLRQKLLPGVIFPDPYAAGMWSLEKAANPQEVGNEETESCSEKLSSLRRILELLKRLTDMV